MFGRGGGEKPRYRWNGGVPILQSFSYLEYHYMEIEEVWMIGVAG
jgi:hypothetical protein